MKRNYYSLQVAKDCKNMTIKTYLYGSSCRTSSRTYFLIAQYLLSIRIKTHKYQPIFLRGRTNDLK